MKAYKDDTNYLKRFQYQDPSRLNARILIHRLFSTGTQDWHTFILEHLALRSGMRVLALGCGNAVQWRANRDRFPADVQFILSDISAGMLAEAQADLAGRRNFAFLCQNAGSLAFADASFDLVSANHMLYHLPQPGAALSEAARLLRPDGRLMAATNGGKHMSELDALLREFYPAYQEDVSMHDGFSLENGAELIGRHFEELVLVPYPSNLWVTDAALLSAYAYSSPSVKESFDPAWRERLTAFFQQRIDKDGGIFITKHTGLFLVGKPRPLDW